MHRQGERTAMATLQEMRERANLSRNQLAARTGGVVDVTTIYRIEEGKAVPRLTTQKVIADALGVSVDAIEWPKKGEDKGGD